MKSHRPAWKNKSERSCTAYDSKGKKRKKNNKETVTGNSFKQNIENQQKFL